MCFSVFCFSRQKRVDRSITQTNNRNRGEEASRKCPNCHSKRIWKDGIRRTTEGFSQRFICRDCDHRFSESSVLSTNQSHSGRRQVSAVLTEAKNLTTRQPLRGGLARATKLDAKGKTGEYSWWLRKQDYAQLTIHVYTNAIQLLEKRGANIFDTESVKTVISRQKWGQARENVVVNAYTLFLKMLGASWIPPIYRKPSRKLPFIPTETEIDQLIAASGRKTASFLQLLKETAMRSGEANRIEWSNVDLQRRTITLNCPEKNGNPRIFKVSQKLLDMLDALPREGTRMFGPSANWYKTTYYKSRIRIANKLKNPRLARICLHILRHWKATMLYHQTKDIVYVKEFLGHKRIEDTMLYVQVAEAIFKESTDEFAVKVAKAPKEIQALLEVGFEYVYEKNDLVFFRKRK